MSLGLIGRKVGMTRVFTEEGVSIPVTVLEVKPNRVTQIKTVETDGYTGLQVAFGERRASRINKALTGHYAKAGVVAGSGIKEFNVDLGKKWEIYDFIEIIKKMTKINILKTNHYELRM